MQGINNRNPHCLRSRKLNEEQLLLLKHFGEQPKINKTTYKFIEESLNNFSQDNNRIINKKLKYSPPPITKRPRSFNKKQNSSSKVNKSNQKQKKINKKNKSLDDQNLNIYRKKNIKKLIENNTLKRFYENKIHLFII